jgi:DNA-binding MarR family transcriptional regulator
MLLRDEQIDSNLAPAQQQDKALHVVRRLRRAFLSICRCGDVVFSPYRLTTEQYALIRAVQREPGIRQTEITDKIFAEPNTVTAMVTLLEKRGILRRKSSPSDKRVRQLFLTAHGQAVMYRLATDWKPMRDLLRNCFAGEDGERALEILDEVARRMQLEREKLLQRPHGVDGLDLDEDDISSPPPAAASLGVENGLAKRKSRARPKRRRANAS